MPIRLVNDWREMYERSIGVLTGSNPIFYGRIGGSDTDMVIDYVEGLLARDTDEALLSRVQHHKRMLEQYNGYYDKDCDESKLIRFSQELLDSYKLLTHATLGGGKWLTLYFKDIINSKFWADVGTKAEIYKHLVDMIAAGKDDVFFYPFGFIEKTTSHPWSMFNAFREILKNKRVLVISPFSKTIQGNFHNRRHFFKAYDYPEFDLTTYATPITYKGLPDDLYPHRDWFSTVAAMKAEIQKLDFDIALLSCGSYAMPLGDFICHQLGKKAIYIGGVLQLYFGILGRRYLNAFFLDQINQEYFVYAEEREIYMKHVTIAADTATEGFAAYL